MLAKLIRRIKCCSVQEILMIVSIIMLLIYGPGIQMYKRV